MVLRIYTSTVYIPYAFKVYIFVFAFLYMHVCPYIFQPSYIALNMYLLNRVFQTIFYKVSKKDL